MTYVAYLSHPIGPPDGDEKSPARHQALEHAAKWMRLLVKRTTWAIMCPWLAYRNVIDGTDIFGPRALTDQVTMLERCDVITQVGGWISPHMQIEANHAKRRGIPVLDLTDLGTRPIQEEHIGRQLHLRAAILEKHEKRRAWMPPLDELDIAALRAAQIALQADLFSDDAKAVIARIVSAATRR